MYTREKFLALKEEYKKVYAGIDRTKISCFKHCRNLIIGLVPQILYSTMGYILIITYIFDKIVAFFGVTQQQTPFLWWCFFFAMMFWGWCQIAGRSNFRYRQDKLVLYLEKHFPLRCERLFNL